MTSRVEKHPVCAASAPNRHYVARIKWLRSVRCGTQVVVTEYIIWLLQSWEVKDLFSQWRVQ